MSGAPGIDVLDAAGKDTVFRIGPAGKLDDECAFHTDQGYRQRLRGVVRHELDCG